MSTYAVSTRGLAAHKLPQGTLATIMEMLYANSEKGIAKLDFSDFTGMYQDRARTIPYTAVEQPLGSFTGLNGVTATAPADVNRGVVSARVNLLQSNSIDSWVETTGVSITLYSVGDVHPGSNVFKLTYDGSGVAGDYRSYSNSAPYLIGKLGTGYSSFIYFRADTPVTIGFSNNSNWGNLTVVNVTTVWQKVPISGVGNDMAAVQILIHSAPGDNTPLNLYFSSADVRLTINSHLPYQRVNTATDYDTVGFPHRLVCNGTNTIYVTPNIDFSGTDKMTVWAGVDVESMSGLGPLLVHPNYGYSSFQLSIPGYEAGKVSFACATDATVAAASLAIEIGPNTITAEGDLGTRSVAVNINGASASAVIGSGGGNFTNAQLSIGGFAGVGFFTGGIYSLIARGAATPLPQIEAVENLIRKTMRRP